MKDQKKIQRISLLFNYKKYDHKKWILRPTPTERKDERDNKDPVLTEDEVFVVVKVGVVVEVEVEVTVEVVEEKGLIPPEKVKPIWRFWNLFSHPNNKNIFPSVSILPFKTDLFVN